METNYTSLNCFLVLSYFEVKSVNVTYKFDFFHSSCLKATQLAIIGPTWFYFILLRYRSYVYHTKLLAPVLRVVILY